MPTTAHEVPILLFRDQPELLLRLLRDGLLAAPPRYDRVQDKSNDLSVLVLVLEVQRAPDEDKLASWPGYVGELVHRYHCPVYLVVAATDEATARWAGEPNPYFQLNSPFLPLVVAPQDIPLVVNIEEARRAPEVALLSLSVHGSGPRGEEVAETVTRVAREAGTEYKVICVMLLMQLLDETKRHSLEVKLGMNLQEWLNPKYEIARNAFRLVEAYTEAKDLLKVLAGRGLAVTPQEQERILRCEDVAILDRWLLRAGTASSTAEVLEG